MSLDPRRLHVAVQKAGRLTDRSLDLLERSGLRFTRGRDQLACLGENLPIDLLLVRDDDIPELVEDGTCELGILGQNVLAERKFRLREDGREAPWDEVQPLEFGHCRLCIAVPEAMTYTGPESMAGTTVASSHPATLRAFLDERGIEAEVVTLSGALEIAPRLGRADLICDLVSTGATLAANQLREVETISSSQATMIRTRRPIDPDRAQLVERMLTRLDAVLRVQESKYIMLHAPREALQQIKELLPGAESPTVLPLEGRDDRVAVHAVCRETVFWETLETLKSAGATAMLVVPVEKMLG